MRFRFGRYELDEEAGELRREGSPVALQPKPFELLRVLLRERERVVPADELFEQLWPGVAVTPSSLTRAVSLARRAIGDTHQGKIIRSVSRRGYRFCGDVVAIGAARAATGAAGGERPEPAGEAGRPADREPFVGRGDALERLEAAWRDAVEGRGSLVVISGPAGIGKTRLVERFAAEAARTGARVLSGRCRDDEGVPAFWLWVQVLRGLIEGGAEADELAPLRGAAAELGELVPGLGAAAPDASDPGAPGRERSRFLLFDAVTRSLLRAGARRPLVVVLEDVQWAGSASLRLLEHLTYEIGGGALLVLATARAEPRPPDHPLERALPALRQQPRCLEIALRGFSRREVGALLEQVLGRQPPPDLTSELFARTEGVPLFLREAIRLLDERGDLQRPDRIRRWAVTLPTHALDLIRRPLGRLSPECSTLVGAAAVLGREFPLALVAPVAETTREAALDLLDEAERAGVVEPAPDDPGSWRFVHALFQEAAREALPAGRRARLHARAAEELERRHAEDLDRVIGEIAHHRHEALAVAEPEEAFACARRAAERATRLLAHEQAAVHWRQAVAALDHLEAADPARRLETLLALGEAHRLAGEREPSRAAFAEAMDAARALARPRDVASAAIGFCDLSEWAPKDDEAWRRVEEALAQVPEDAASERARLLTRLAYLSMREAPELAEPRAREAVALARRAGDAEGLQDALYALFFRLAGPDHLAERAALAEETLAAVRASRLTDPALIALLDRACDAVLLGDPEEARRWRALADEVAGRDPNPTRSWHLHVHEAGLALMEGRFADAEASVEECARLGRRISHPYATGVDRAMRVWLARERGDHARVLRIFEPRRPIRIGPVQWVQVVVARSLAALGRTGEARELFEDVVSKGAAEIPRNIRWHATVCETALVCADLGDEDRAAELLALLEPVREHHAVLPVPIYYNGPFTRCLARLQETLGELAAADDLFEEALESVDRMGALPMRATLRLEHGRLRARRGDRRRAREALAEAGELATDLGMAGVAAAARESSERL